MNVGNILKVADAIEQSSVPDLGFNLGSYVMDGLPSGNSYDKSGHGCGTCACIAGWTRAVETQRHPEFGRDGDIHDKAREFLGINSEMSFELFLPAQQDNDDAPCPYNATPVEAARVLRNLAITGKVDWEAAMKSADPVLPALPAPAPAGKVRA